MKTETQPQDRKSTSDRFSLALFVVCELLCTGVLVAAVILWS